MIALNDVKLGPLENLLLRWDGEVWHANYQRRLSPPAPRDGAFHLVEYARGDKSGIPGETADEVARGAMQNALLADVK